MYAHVQNAARQPDLEPGKKNKSSHSENAHPLMQLQSLVGNQDVAQRATIQRKENENEEEDKRKNRTGLPDNLKTGIETLSGVDLSDVKVHYNSDKPAQIQALAYAQGNEIHLGPGQEAHLPHEAWHVVQQKQGRVKPTMMNGDVPINDNPELEAEADRMGQKALQMKTDKVVQRQQTEVYVKNVSGTYKDGSGKTRTFTLDGEHYVTTTKSHPKGRVNYDDKVKSIVKKLGAVPKEIDDDQITVTYTQFGRKR